MSKVFPHAAGSARPDLRIVLARAVSLAVARAFEYIARFPLDGAEVERPGAYTIARFVVDQVRVLAPADYDRLNHSPARA